MKHALLAYSFFSTISIFASEAPQSPEKPRPTSSFQHLLVRPKGGAGRRIHSGKMPVAGIIYSIESKFESTIGSTTVSEVIKWRGSLFEEGHEDPEMYTFLRYEGNSSIPSGYWSLRKADVGFTSECTHFLTKEE